MQLLTVISVIDSETGVMRYEAFDNAFCFATIKCVESMLIDVHSTWGGSLSQKKKVACFGAWMRLFHPRVHCTSCWRVLHSLALQQTITVPLTFPASVWTDLSGYLKP